MQTPIKKIAMDLIERNGLLFTLIDVGSRNGIMKLSDLAPYTDAFGFEPNPEEYKKLVRGNTDASAFGLVSPPYRNIRYYPYAISNENGRSTFYVTPGPGAAGLLEPNLQRLNEIVFHGGKSYRTAFGKEVFDNFKAIEVETKTLNNVCRENDIYHIDLLKIDVEGSEYDVLEGAYDILGKTGVIFMETCFSPVRKNQKLFSHVDLLLREFDFDLLHYEIVQQQVGYKTLRRPTHYIPPFYYDPHGQPLSCDAIYINREIKDPIRLLAQGLVLLEQEFIDEALYVLEKKCGLSDKTLLGQLRNCELHFSKGHNLRHRGYQLVDSFVNLLGKIRRRISDYA